MHKSAAVETAPTEPVAVEVSPPSPAPAPPAAAPERPSTHPDVALEMRLARAIAAQVPPTLPDEPPPPEAIAEPEILAPAKVSPPKPEPVEKPLPFKPDPVSEALDPYRPTLAERLIPYLAALVGLVALGVTLYLDLQNRERFIAMWAELVQIRTALEEMVAAQAVPPVVVEAPAPEPVANDGTIDALLALQERVATLEAEAASAPAADTPPTPLEPAVGTMTQTVLGDGPTTDCIPVGTRFVALTGEAYPICRTPEVITLSDINGEGVTVKGGETVVEGGFTRLRFGTCTLMVLSADVEGFAELRVACT